MNKEKDFGQGSVSANILRLAIPMTPAQLINVLYNVVGRALLAVLFCLFKHPLLYLFGSSDATSTILSQCVSCILVLHFLTGEKSITKLTRKQFLSKERPVSSPCF